MCDRDSKNAFSAALSEALIAAFDEVSQHNSIKVVVLTGYDSYFASGGTRESLLSMSQGSSRFADSRLYRLPLDCPLPVIAAMQGHAIGGGFVFGLFCDLAILSRESVYTTNFMRYGFTPGMGATHLVPNRLGLALGTEMLFTANSYRGDELRSRGVPYDVLPRPRVLPKALEIASALAEMPRISLIALKRRLSGDLRKCLSDAIDAELIMHDATFGLDEVRQKIESLYPHRHAPRE
jgi:polyketide biosynthesis enoyl-CoA hydratase PksI